MPLFFSTSPLHNSGMIYGHARVSTDGQSVAAQVAALAEAGASKVFRETASGAKTDGHSYAAPWPSLSGATCY